MQGCVRASDCQFDLRKGGFDKKSSKTYKCNSYTNIRYCEHCVANFMLAYGDEEHVDSFFCEVASLRKQFVGQEIKKLLQCRADKM